MEHAIDLDDVFVAGAGDGDAVPRSKPDGGRTSGEWFEIILKKSEGTMSGQKFANSNFFQPDPNMTFVVFQPLRKSVLLNLRPIISLLLSARLPRVLEFSSPDG